MKTVQEKTDAKLKEMADLKTEIGCLASCIDVNQEKAEACHCGMKAAIHSIHLTTF
jgi:hypothetical protein